MRQLPNESAKTHRFAALIGELFPGSRATTDFVGGVEKVVRVFEGNGAKRRRIDAYYGNAVIEFERSLAATEKTAIRQLREYTAGVWKNEEGTSRTLVCIASDGIVWKVFHPTLVPGKKLVPDAIELQEIRTLVVSENTLRDFWVWLTSFLFRPARLEPTSERFRVDFGATSPAFADALTGLGAIWSTLKRSPEPALAYEVWERYLRVTYGDLPGDLEYLFLKHTYLANVAKLLVWAALSGGRTTKPLAEVASNVLSGEFFVAQKIENLVEHDFFRWVTQPTVAETLSPLWERLLDQLSTYDLALLNQDILKGVYQDLVDPKDRHDLGEYYTPDWLCEAIIQEVLPTDRTLRVLDPTCGSGSFLRAAIAHALAASNETKPERKLQEILGSVVGIDIHPLAVTISRATYVLALRDLIRHARRPIQVPVYLADSLFLPNEVAQIRIGGTPGYRIQVADRTIELPQDLVTKAELFDPAIEAAATVATHHAKTRKENRETLTAFLRQTVPTLMDEPKGEQMVDALWHFVDELADLIRRERNSIWAFILRNSYRPTMLQGRFDVIVGNPPWLSYRYIADPEYQAEVKTRAVEEYAIAPNQQRLMTQMELATVFLVHALKVFGNEQSHLAFVMPRSVLSADQHLNLRNRLYKAPVTIERYWDLLRISPLFNVPACVLFASRKWPRLAPSYKLPVIVWEGRLPERDGTLAEMEPYLGQKKDTARLIYLGRRSAWSTEAGPTTAAQPSTYSHRFHQGATIVPRNCYFVRLREEFRDADRLYWVETDPEQAEQAKEPWKDVRLAGSVEGRFLFGTALSRHLLPFGLIATVPIVLPVERTGSGLMMRTPEQLRRKGDRHIADWMEKVEKLWTDRGSAKGKIKRAIDRLDYQRGLTTQNPAAGNLVLYNAAGTNLSAAHFRQKTSPLPFIVEHKLYWAAFESDEEADYVTAILNSAAVNEAIKPFQSHGLMGERDIEKKVLDLPIPRFRERDRFHRRLAALGARAAQEANVIARSEDLPSSLAKRRSVVRDGLEEALGEIDEIVIQLLKLPA